MARKPSFGTANTVIVIDPAGVASASATQSSYITNTDFLDATILLQLSIGAGTLGGQRAAFVYAYANAGGTEWPDGVAATASAITLFNPTNLVRIATIFFSAQSQTRGKVIPSLAGALGNVPQQWGLVIENNTGITFDTTSANHKIVYQGQAVT